MYCRECGKNIGRVKICPHCSCDNRGKSRLTAGFLQILAGSLGLGRFYLGYRDIALLQIAASLISFGTAGVIWGFIDGMMILCGTPETDADGVTLLK